LNSVWTYFTNVALQLGHLTNGEAVTGVTSSDLFSLCEERLGFLLPVEVIKRNTVKLSWLNNAFRELPDNETEVVISQHAHGHILTLIGSLLMPDTSASLVHLMYLPLLIDLNNVSNYNWGAVVLACLYRALDHWVDFNQTNIGGCMLLLQSWAWYQITSITPTVDTLSDEDIEARMAFHWLRGYFLCPSQCIISLIYIYFLKN